MAVTKLDSTKNLLLSMLHALVTFRRTPVIFVNGQLVSHGRVPRPDELRQWIQEARVEQS